MNTEFKIVEQTIKLITKEDALNHPNKNYNPTEWEKAIESYCKYDNVQFHTIKGQVYDEDVMVLYTLPSGIRYRKTVSYGSMLSSSGLTQCTIYKNIVRRFNAYLDGKPVSVSKTNEGRKFMKEVCDDNELAFFE